MHMCTYIYAWTKEETHTTQPLAQLNTTNIVMKQGTSIIKYILSAYKS